jgi:hypothetical protein
VFRVNFPPQTNWLGYFQQLRGSCYRLTITFTFSDVGTRARFVALKPGGCAGWDQDKWWKKQAWAEGERQKYNERIKRLTLICRATATGLLGRWCRFQRIKPIKGQMTLPFAFPLPYPGIKQFGLGVVFGQAAIRKYLRGVTCVAVASVRIKWSVEGTAGTDVPLTTLRMLAPYLLRVLWRR